MTATALAHEAIAFNDRDEHTTPDLNPVPQPVRSNAPSQYARFIDEEIRYGSVAPDMRILKDRCKTWLRNDEPGISEAWLESKACGLVSFTRAFVAGYTAFRNAPASV
ncbi:TPA: hypothetical protein QDA71_002461 [Burkholderia vietnamiensis]|uniref:hypothetical protein n=1 Tax=Burkholderia TaxID=32008 RepID=UPI001588FD05|nr:MULTISPECIES: hypothetical protein [Burkholderia]HDR8945468.1 hypothetical protein [Burkholderia vietnamiensis]HDR9206701.1 hypothetical protein [Burkholderia vietnamiensis]